MFFEKHDCNFMNKFLVKLEEANTKTCLENANVLKGRITAGSMSFNPKNSKTIVAENFCRVVMTTNGSCPVDMSDGERRFAVIPCSSEKKGDLDYWTKVRQTIRNNEYGRAVAKMLLERDINDFCIQKLPENNYQEIIVESRKSCEEQFLEQWNGESCGSDELYNQYMTYCRENTLPSIDNKLTFCKTLVKFARTFLKVRRTNNGMIYSK
jgi:hypothetical protein